MSEVKLNTPAISTGHPDAGRVYAAAYEAAVVAHDAQRLRADTAEAALDNYIKQAVIDTAHRQARLATAEQRIAELAKELFDLKHAVWHMLDDSGDGEDESSKSIMTLDFEKLCGLVPEEWHDAALNPNPEAESHE